MLETNCTDPRAASSDCTKKNTKTVKNHSYKKDEGNPPKKKKKKTVYTSSWKPTQMPTLLTCAAYPNEMKFRQFPTAKKRIPAPKIHHQTWSYPVEKENHLKAINHHGTEAYQLSMFENILWASLQPSHLFPQCPAWNIFPSTIP